MNGRSVDKEKLSREMGNEKKAFDRSKTSQVERAQVPEARDHDDSDGLTPVRSKGAAKANEVTTSRGSSVHERNMVLCCRVRAQVYRSHLRKSLDCEGIGARARRRVVTTELARRA